MGAFEQRGHNQTFFLKILKNTCRILNSGVEYI